MVSHKASLNKFERIQIMQGVFSGHSAIKLELNNKDNKKIPKCLDIDILV